MNLDPSVAPVSGQHFAHRVQASLQPGRSDAANDVVNGLLAEHASKVAALKKALDAGLQSGKPVPFDSAAFLRRMHAQHA